MSPLQLGLNRFRLHFTPEKPVFAAFDHGFIWRGSLGNQLKALSCAMTKADCENCMLKTACSYQSIFESPPPPRSARMTKYTAVPHPYVLTPICRNRNNNEYLLELGLVGKANQSIGIILEALRRAAERGLQHGIGKLAFNGVEHWHDAKQQWLPLASNSSLEDAVNIPACPQGDVQIQFLSPLRLKHPGRKGEKQRLIRASELEFHHIFRVLLRRLSALSYFHADREIQADFKNLSEHARAVHFNFANLHWLESQRHSSRQQATIPMGGIIGNVHVPGKRLQEFWPYLWTGQWINIGKGASMGMGHYRLFNTEQPA